MVVFKFYGYRSFRKLMEDTLRNKLVDAAFACGGLTKFPTMR